jgi:uncharacterized protein (TIGR02145 family)
MANIENENLIISHIKDLLDNKGLLKTSPTSAAASVYLKSYSSDFKTKKIENAIKAYAPTVSIDDVIFFVDATLMGSGKNGFIMTSDSLFWDGGMLVGKGHVSLGAGNVFSSQSNLLHFNGKAWVTEIYFKQDVFIQGMNELMEKISGKRSFTPESPSAQPSAAANPVEPLAVPPVSVAGSFPINASVMANFVIAVFKNAIENGGIITKESVAKTSFYVKGFANSSFKMKKIENALAEYAHTAKSTDDALVYYDSTTFGSGKEGFFISSENVFWKFGSNVGFTPWNELQAFTGSEKPNYNGREWSIDGVSGKAFANAMNTISSSVRLFEDLSKGYQVPVQLNLGAVRAKTITPDQLKSAIDALNASATSCYSVGMESKGSTSDDIIDVTYYFGTEKMAQDFSAAVKQGEGCQNGSYTVSDVKGIDIVWSQMSGLVNVMYSHRRLDLSSFIDFMNFNLKLDNHTSGNASKFSYGTFTDPRDGEVYHTVKIGDFEWMVENLRYKTEGGFADEGKGSRVYGDNPENLKRYGRLYTWAAAMNLPDKYNSIPLSPETQRKWGQGNFQGIAPEGWHIPYHAELALLMDYIAERSDDSTQSALANPLLWDKKFGTDSFGFNLVPGGFYEDGEYTFQGEAALLWTSNPSTAVIVTDEKSEISTNASRSGYLSIRCVRNVSQEIFAKVVQRSKDLAKELEAKRKAQEEAERKAREIAEHEKRMEVMEAQRKEAETNQRIAKEEAEKRAESADECIYCGYRTYGFNFKCKKSPTGYHVRRG